MMTNKEKRFLSKLKYNAFKLKDNGQIPYSLYKSILNLNFESSLQNLKDLQDLSEKYIRLKGYYLRHPDMSYECDEELRKLGYYR